MSRISVDIYTPTDPRLGRQVEHDERSRRFALFPKDTKPQGIDTHWLSHAGPLNQGQIGSCTTNALSQWLNTDFAANILTAKHHGKYMTEADALELYKMATRLDAIPGFYPEEDTGSTGNAACKAGMKAKLLQAYSWVFSFSSTQATLEKQPVMLGTLWTNSMFKPNNGLVKVGPLTDQNTAGGHEYLGAGIEYKNEVIVCRNSWGDKSDWPGCKPGGYFAIGFKEFAALLEADGDVTIPH